MPKWKRDHPVTIAPLEERLHVITTEWTMAHGVKRLHSYLLELPSGNLLFHGPDRVSFYREHSGFFEERGGIAHHVLTHHADAAPACRFVAEKLGAPVCVHEADAAATAKRTKLEVAGSFSEQTEIAPGLEALPLPGHTAGFAVYGWTGERGRYLFGGDVIFRDPQGWTAFFSHRPYAVGVESLERLMRLWATPCPRSRSGAKRAKRQLAGRSSESPRSTRSERSQARGGSSSASGCVAGSEQTLPRHR